MQGTSTDKTRSRGRRWYAAPLTIVSRVRAGLSGLRTERSSLRHTDDAEAHRQGALPGLIKRRYFYALAISEIVGTFIAAPLLGTFFQYYYGSAYYGIAGTIIGDYVPGISMFVVLWVVLNRNLYFRPPTLGGKLREAGTELAPFFVIGMIAAFPAYVITAGISIAYVKGAEQLSASFAHAFPVIVVSETLNYVVEEAMFIYIDLKLIKKPLAAFIDRYGAVLDDDANRATTRGAP